MFTPAFERFVRPARPRAQLWRLILGIIVMLGVYGLGIAAIIGLIWMFSGTSGLREWVIKITTASGPTGTLLLLASFIGMALAPMVVVRVLHRRPAASLFGPRVIVLRDFALSGGIVLLIFGLFTIGWSFFFEAVPNLNFGQWLMFLPLALLGVAIQTGAEELVFRGYLQQQLAARFRSPLIWMAVPAGVFGLIHLDPLSNGGNAWLVVAAATVFGLLAADLTRVTGSVGAGWGFHFANNVLAILVIAVDGTVPGLALYLTPYTAADASQLPLLILIDLAGLLIAWATLRHLLRR